MNLNGRPWYFWPLIAFVVGLLIGWLVIGWGLWPVTWTNALVQDLRPDLRNQYVTMVAESFAQTRDLAQARDRLAGWSSEELAKMLGDVQEVLVVRDVAASRNVQELANALGASRGTGGTDEGQPTPPPTATPVPPETGNGFSLRKLCTAGLFLLLALGALALLTWLFRRWRAAQGGAGSEDSEPPFDTSDAAANAAAVAEQEKARWSSSEPVTKDEYQIRRWAGDSSTQTRRVDVDDSGPRVSAQDDRSGFSLRPIGPSPVISGKPEPTEPRATAQPAPQPVPPVTGPLTLLSENTAVYQMGEPDYDEAFDISDPVDGYMGQCGLQLSQPFGRERDQAVALQVWLWDSSDPDTQALVLMSEGAYRDTSLRSEHEGEHKSLAVKPGTEFELHSHDLMLRGRVEKVTYAEVEPLRGVFADLHVRLTVYRRAQS